MKGLLVALLIVLGFSVLAGHGGLDLGGSTNSTNAGAAPATEHTTRWRIGSGCSAIAIAPGRDRANNRVVGSTRYRCERPGGELALTLYLQRKDAGRGWLNLDQREILTEPKDTTLDRSEKNRTVSVGAGCADGVYRTFVRGSARIGDRAPQVIEESSPPTTNPCRGLREG